METLETIFTRRSVRRFTGEAVSEKIIEKLLRAAMSAPSANNRQPWQFVVVNERDKLNKIADEHPYGKMCHDAPLAMIACYDTDLESEESYGIQDVSAAIQNILLAARDCGLGSVWLGVHPRDDRMAGVRKIFNIPESLLPIGIVVIGHSEVEQKPIDRFQADRIHYNVW